MLKWDLTALRSAVKNADIFISQVREEKRSCMRSFAPAAERLNQFRLSHVMINPFTAVSATENALKDDRDYLRRYSYVVTAFFCTDIVIAYLRKILNT